LIAREERIVFLNLLGLVELLALDNLDIITYASPLKLVATGKILGFNSKTKLIDFGCGRGDALDLWGKYFGVIGIGIEINNSFCDIARQKLGKNGLSKKIKIACCDASTYEFQPHAHDVATCINAPFIWGGFRGTLRKLKTTINDTGSIVIGEPYYFCKDVPAELRESEGDFHTEGEILDIIHEEDCEQLFVKRASHDECDNYRAHFRGKLQEVSARYMSNYMGSALFAMKLK
jgi:bifunctional DNA-binding transcriptional regulator/antitoxin component of YhaV-PrlF toxin-antitoxin module